ncbi:hypothetical protein LR004_02010 [Candidatus Gracilibacteria bacterium]|nr:hypothetical protein [Candidatus Gracilibacteria bacterium]
MEILVLIGIIGAVFIGGYVIFTSGNIQSYSTQKRDIQRVYSSLSSDINVDKNDNHIEAKNIENIGKSILFFQKRVINLQKAFISERIIEQNILEEKWLIDFGFEFITKLNHWLTFHSGELQKLSSKLDNHKENSNKENFQGSLILHKKIIETQIQEIEQIKR